MAERRNIPGLIRRDIRDEVRRSKKSSVVQQTMSSYPISSPGVTSPVAQQIDLSAIDDAIDAHDTDADAHGGVEAEVADARGTFDTLDERLDDIETNQIPDAIDDHDAAADAHGGVEGEVSGARGGYDNLNARLNAMSIGATIPGYMMEAGIGQATTLAQFDALTHHMECGIEFSQDGSVRFRPQYPDGNTWTWRLSMVVNSNGAQTAHFQTIRTLYYFRVYVDGSSAGNYDNGSGVHTMDVSLASGDRVVQILLTSDGSGDMALILGAWLTANITWVRAASS